MTHDGFDLAATIPAITVEDAFSELLEVVAKRDLEVIVSAVCFSLFRHTSIAALSKVERALLLRDVRDAIAEFDIVSRPEKRAVEQNERQLHS